MGSSQIDSNLSLIFRGFQVSVGEMGDGGLSVLCADVVEGTRLAVSSAGQDAAYAVGRCENRIRRSVESHGGSLVSRQGGGLMAFFKNNVSALQSAIEMQHRILDLPPASGVSLAVRVGICSGHEAKEVRYFPSEGTNPAVSLSSATQPGGILLSIPRRVKVFDWLQLAMDSVPDMALSCGKRRLGVFQVGWQERDPGALRLALSQLGKTAGRLFINHRGVIITLDETRPLTTIGRHPDCDLLLRDSRCSRSHGTIERRLDRFIFVDRSSNGTFVTFEDQSEVFVHKQELALFGSGQLSFGARASAKGVDQVQFHSAGLLR